MFATYEQTLTFLYENLPMFQRQGILAYRKDLTNTVELCRRLGNPERKVKTIHVAGTNGKGSTSHMIASILQAAGYKTGLYTSPHLKNFTERIRINGEEISKEFVVDFVNRVHPLIETLRPSFFELTVGMAFDFFAQQKVDVAVIETGLGGRLDSTNVITPEVALITNIGLDHQDILGDTIQKIAVEKAGIIKPKTPVVISERQHEVAQVFLDKATSCDAPIYFATDDYRVESHPIADKIAFNVYYKGDLIFRDLNIPLQGYYQRKNLSGVLKAVEILDNLNWGLTAQHVIQGLSDVVSKTGLKGRWQKLNDVPLVICDTAHNLDGIREIIAQIKTQSFQKLHIVWGCVKDKDLQHILEVLPTNATYYFCEPKIPRALNASDLAAQASVRGLSGYVVSDVNDALSKAMHEATKHDMIFVGGSTFVVAEINNL
ncbi:MAG TPA: folylpolyglutamate synthase/dihydrofolate synthase family protein [Ohtaekwangia sp.]|nr:folylpolyglutamate synthase/dihydrofolate synthase family protein [Ohtaekwangia sp.]